MKVAQYEVLGCDAKEMSVPPSLRFGAAFKLRAQRSSKSEGGILNVADRPGRVAFSKKQPSICTGLLSSGPVGLIFSGPTELCDHPVR